MKRNKNTETEQNFNPGLKLIGLSGTGPWLSLSFSLSLSLSLSLSFSWLIHFVSAISNAWRRRFGEYLNGKWAARRQKRHWRVVDCFKRIFAREKTFLLLKLVEIILKNEVVHPKCDSMSSIRHRIWSSTYWFLRRIKNESNRRKTSLLREGTRTNNKLNVSIMVQLPRFKHWPHW